MKYLLASTSPRRKELLKNILENFEIASPHFDERSVKIENPKKLVKVLAEGKASAVFEKAVGDWCVIGADSIVVFENEVLGKPKDRDDAIQMLKKLRDKSHKVMTGVCVMYRRGEMETKITFVEISKVFFDDISDKEIENYVDSKEPMDKAGGYAIQGLAGKYINKIDGNFHNIVGLPIAKLYKILKQEGLI